MDATQSPGIALAGVDHFGRRFDGAFAASISATVILPATMSSDKDGDAFRDPGRVGDPSPDRSAINP